MALSKIIELRRFWHDSNDLITTVEYIVTFSDSTQFPGVKSVHHGNVPFTEYNLTKNATTAQIINALKGFGGPDYNAHLDQFHTEQLRYLYNLEVNTEVDKRPVVLPTEADVDAERDRRIALGFDFQGVNYQTRPDDRENIAGASQVALKAIIDGVEPGDLYWHGGDLPFMWIATDNSLHTMDAYTMFSFGEAAMAHKQYLIFKARAIKDTDPIPTDYTNDSYWV